MDMGDLEALSKKVEKIVDNYVSAKNKNKTLVSRNKELEKKVACLEKHLQKSEKEVKHIARIVARNKAYEKNYSLLRSKLVSVLAKVDSLQ
jgi:predicted RNase H-like nuclease (RuvC/YqgF family)